MDMALQRRLRTLEKVRGLRQAAEPWQATVRRARTWVTAPDEPPSRPYVLLIVTEERELLVRTAMLQQAPTADAVFTELLHGMVRPIPGGGPPHRPAAVVLDDAGLVAALSPWLADVGVPCAYRVPLAAVDAALDALETHLNRRPLIPGLLSLPGVTVPLVGHLYELAAAFYRQAPWTWLDDAHPIEIRSPADAPPRYVVVIGSMRTVFGLVAYDAFADLQKSLTYAGSGPPPPTSSFALFFDEPLAMSFDDLDAMERYGWAPVNPRAYPVFGRSTRDGRITPPHSADLLWAEGALGALLYYLRRHGRQRRVRPVAATVPVSTIGGEVPVQLRLPVPLRGL